MPTRRQQLEEIKNYFVSVSSRPDTMPFNIELLSPERYVSGMIAGPFVGIGNYFEEQGREGYRFHTSLGANSSFLDAEVTRNCAGILRIPHIGFKLLKFLKKPRRPKRKSCLILETENHGLLALVPMESGYTQSWNANDRVTREQLGRGGL